MYVCMDERMQSKNIPNEKRSVLACFGCFFIHSKLFSRVENVRFSKICLHRIASKILLLYKWQWILVFSRHFQAVETDLVIKLYFWLGTEEMSDFFLIRSANIRSKLGINKWDLPLWINEEVFLRPKTVESPSICVVSDALSDDFNWLSPMAATDDVFKATVPLNNNWCCCCCCWCCICLYGKVYWCGVDDDDDDGKYCSPLTFLLLLWIGLSSVSELLTEYAGYSRFLPAEKKEQNFIWIIDIDLYTLGQGECRSSPKWPFSFSKPIERIHEAYTHIFCIDSTDRRKCQQSKKVP